MLDVRKSYESQILIDSMRVMWEVIGLFYKPIFELGDKWYCSKYVHIVDRGVSKSQHNSIRLDSARRVDFQADLVLFHD